MPGGQQIAGEENLRSRPRWHRAALGEERVSRAQGDIRRLVGHLRRDIRQLVVVQQPQPGG